MYGARMSGATATATASKAANDSASMDTPPVGPYLLRVAERFGVPVVIMVLVLWWARNDVVQPLLDAHFGFINRIVEGQERHTREIEGVVERLDRLIEITESQ